MIITGDDKYALINTQLSSIYDSWPEHFSRALSLGVAVKRPANYYESIILCGMGGSGTSCDIINELLSNHGKIPSTVVKGGTLPSSVNKYTLALTFSASGNTEETVLMAKQAHFNGADVVCISSGGELKEFADMSGITNINIPNLLLPRAALPYMLMPGVCIVKDFLDPNVAEKISGVSLMLSEIRDKISTTVPYEDNSAKRLATFLSDGFVFCFTSPYLKSIGTRFKNSLNENAKLHCTVESVLEACHNEIVPFTYLGEHDPKKVLLVRWAYDSEITGARFDKLCHFFSEIGQPFYEFEIEQESILSAIINGTYFLDFVSIYLAIIRKIDPSPTPAIDILKRLE